VVARCVHARLVVCLSRSLVLEAGAGGAGPAEASVWTWLSSWEVLGRGQLDRVADQDRPGAREDRSSVGSRCAARPAFGRLIGIGGESLGRSCRVEPNIKKPIGHLPLAKQS
jgi:hypothetical protein